MNYARCLNNWKIFHLTKAFKRYDHRVHSNVYLNRNFNMNNKTCIHSNKLDSFKCMSTSKALDVADKEQKGFLKKFMDKVGWLDLNQSRQKFNGYLLFESVVDQTNYEYWFNECKLPDTFHSWFMVTELHVWMLLVRCMGEGSNGKLLRNAIIDALWSDTLVKIQRLGVSSKINKNLDQLSNEFQAALIGYDEGLLGDDIVLASALWRRLYQKSTQDAVQIENLVRYIRKQIKLLEEIPADEFMNRPKIKWIPLVDRKV